VEQLPNNIVETYVRPTIVALGDVAVVVLGDKHDGTKDKMATYWEP